MIKFSNAATNGRKSWNLDNGTASLAVTVGGGHIASLVLNEKPDVNPLWVPVWKPVEPWQYKAADAKKYELKLLAGICGHNVCLGWFGDPSPDEMAAGMECHGEAPVAKWDFLKKTATGFECGCDMPVVGMSLVRSISTVAKSNVFTVKETVKSTSKRDTPYTMCEHVTFGPPFLKKGETVFDMPAVQSHTYRGKFSDRQRLRPNAPFAWPRGPGHKGEMVDMRTIGNAYSSSSDFTSQLIDPKRLDAWFTAVNSELGVMVAYVWKRSDFPWVGNWEENYGRKTKPWNGKSLARGMEFANTPFPVGLRKAIEMAHFHGQPTYRWLPAMGQIEYQYDIIIMPVSEDVMGVKDIYKKSTGYVFEFVK